jgi:thiamine biosynthesis protein ThiI
MEPSFDLALVSYGEIGTKSRKVRTDMVRLLAQNIDALLRDRGVDGEVERRWSRVLVHADDAERAAEVAADAFGVVASSPAIRCEPTMEAIHEAIRELTVEHEPGETFAVRARRTGTPDAHPFSSRDIERTGGGVVIDETDAPVDLDDPDRTYHVECREEDAFVYADSFEGPGGIPLGTQGKAVVLLSGGIDSPVAAWQMMRRGVSVVPAYVDLGDFGGPDHVARAVETARQLARYAPDRDLRLRVIPAGDLVADLAAEVNATRMLSLRRAMLKMAETIAEEESAHSIVTGESLGQKSSQTGVNLRVTDAAVDLPVHRPLLTRDKTEIVALARRIGTYDDSTIPVGCERVAPSYPETYATLEQVEAAEPDDLLERAADVAKNRRVVEWESFGIA